MTWGFQQYGDLWPNLKLHFYLQVQWKNVLIFQFFFMSKFLNIPAIEAFNYNTDSNLAFELGK